MPKKFPKIICEKCHKLFVPNLFFSSNCIHCTYESESDITVIRRFVKDNPGLTAIQLAELTGIKLSNIMIFVKTELAINTPKTSRSYDANRSVDASQGHIFTAKGNN